MISSYRDIDGCLLRVTKRIYKNGDIDYPLVELSVEVEYGGCGEIFTYRFWPIDPPEKIPEKIRELEELAIRRTKYKTRKGLHKYYTGDRHEGFGTFGDLIKDK